MALELSKKDIRGIRRGKTNIICVGCGKLIKNGAINAYLDAIETGHVNPLPICYKDSEPNDECAKKYTSIQQQLETYSKN